MKPDFKKMSNKALTQYFLVNRHDKEVLKELKTRKGDISIEIPSGTTPEKMKDILKRAL